MADETECPTCGRTDFKNRRGVLLHHANAHGESLVEVTRECDECGEEFQRHESMVDINGHNFCSDQCSSDYLGREHSGENSWHWKGDELVVECAYCGKEARTNTEKIERNEMHYCSRECAGKHRSERFSGEDHPNYNRVEVECAWCGATLERIKARVENYDRQFCDNECKGDWRSENRSGKNAHNYGADFPTGEDHPAYKKQAVNCAWCGNELERIPARLERSENHFCDFECHGDWKSANLQGENHHQYQGGQANYGLGWTPRKRQDVRERDNNQCQDCGMSSAEHKEKYNAKLHVHHIVPARKFDGSERAHRPENLITLCNKCHMKWERVAGLKPDKRD